MILNDLKIGRTANVKDVGGKGSLRQHFLDMGIVPGAELKLVKRAPMGDPIEIIIHGYSLTLRKEEAEKIEIEESTESEVRETEEEVDFGYNLSLHEHNAHPGLGEEGKYHSRENENPLPKDTVLTFALAGQQNCGKTTVFNKLTGANQHVGNFPGVTVDRKDGHIKGHPETVVTDLPGIYSLSTYTEEELVSRRFLLEEKPKAIINVVDAGNIERHLYLTIQLMELGIPMVLAVNMMDELKANDGAIRLNEMERWLGIPVVPVAAAKGEGLEELVEHAVHTARYQEAPQVHDFCSPSDCGGAVHRCLHSIMHLVEDHAQRAGLPLRFVASRLVEGDDYVLDKLDLSLNEKEMLEHIVSQMEKERGLDRQSAIADMRYTFIRNLCRNTVRRPKESRELVRSRRIDNILTGRWTAVPSFIAIIAFVFWLTFDVIGLRLQTLLLDLLGSAGERVSEAFVRWNVSEPVRSLVVDAIFGGVGIVLSFVPIIIVLFFFLSLMEDSGYMARIAFVSDKLLRKIGLSGRSIVPMLIGFGCSVPAVMATRTLPSSRDRKLTVLLIPFMSCSAKVAIYGFFAETFFPGKAGLVMILLYLLGIVAGIIYAFLTKLFRHNREAAPFVMELPVYRLPIPRNVGHLLWDKTKDFVQRAFTVIFITTIVIWFLESFDFRLNYVSSAEGSMLAAVAGTLSPLMAPLGLGDWRIVTSLIAGLMTKESVVAMIQVLGAASAITSVTAVPMLIFCLFYTPCVATVTSIRRELGYKWAIFTVLFQCVLAWACAWIGYMIALS